MLKSILRIFLNILLLKVIEWQNNQPSSSSSYMLTVPYIPMPSNVLICFYVFMLFLLWPVIVCKMNHIPFTCSKFLVLNHHYIHMHIALYCHFYSPQNRASEFIRSGNPCQKKNDNLINDMEAHPKRRLSYFLLCIMDK